MSVDDDYKMDDDYEVGACSMLTILPDIIRDHIITCLGGPTLAVLSCVSTHFNNLSYQHALWEDMCTSLWPSTRDPIVSGIVFTFSSGYRWLFYNCYPRCYQIKILDEHHTSLPVELISAVDISYKDNIIFSKVNILETKSGWFRDTPFCIMMLEKNMNISSLWKNFGKPPKGGVDYCLKQLVDDLKMSWILIDPTKKQAANFSGTNPISVRQQHSTGNIYVKYATVVAGETQMGLATYFVQFSVTVIFAGDPGLGKLCNLELYMKDMDGKKLKGCKGLVILGAVMDGRRLLSSTAEKEKFEAFKEIRGDRKMRRWKGLPLISTGSSF